MRMMIIVHTVYTYYSLYKSVFVAHEGGKKRKVRKKKGNVSDSFQKAPKTEIQKSVSQNSSLNPEFQSEKFSLSLFLAFQNSFYSTLSK